MKGGRSHSCRRVDPLLWRKNFERPPPGRSLAPDSIRSEETLKWVFLTSKFFIRVSSADLTRMRVEHASLAHLRDGALSCAVSSGDAAAPVRTFALSPALVQDEACASQPDV